MVIGIKAGVDFNRDKKADILLYNTVSHALNSWEMKADLSVVKVHKILTFYPDWTVYPKIFDMDGDKYPDIIVQHRLSGAIGSVVMHNFSFKSALVIANPGKAWRVFGVSDVTGDKHSEIFIQNIING